MDVINNKKIMGPLSSGIGAVGGIAQGVINGFFQRSAQNKQYENDVNLLNKQFEINKSMWDLQNAYNDPSAQRDRMEAAGFNPNLLTGGSTTSGNASSAPQYGFTPSPELSSYMDVSSVFDNIGKIVSAKQSVAQLDKIKAEARLALAKESREIAEGARVSGDYQLFVDTYNERLRRYGLENDAIEQSIATGQSQEVENYSRSYLNEATEQKTLLQCETELDIQNNLRVNTKFKENEIPLLAQQGAVLCATAIEKYARANHLNISAQQIKTLTPALFDLYLSQTNLNMATEVLKLLEGAARQMKNENLENYGTENAVEYFNAWVNAINSGVDQAQEEAQFLKDILTTVIKSKLGGKSVRAI